MASLWPASEFASWSHLKTAIVGQILTRSLLKLDIAIWAALQRLFQIASGNKWKRSFWAKSWTGDLLSRIALICSSNALCNGHCGPNPDQEPFEARYCHLGGLAAPIPNCFWKQVETVILGQILDRRPFEPDCRYLQLERSVPPCLRRAKIPQGGRSCSVCRFFPVGRAEPGAV